MLNLFWDLYQQRQISQLQTQARFEQSDVERVARREATSELQSLADRLDRLTLVVHAMWTLMAERTGVTEQQLLARITEIDAQDGVTDGKVTRQPVKCTCGATVCAKFQRCLYCGKEHRATGAFA